MGFVALSYYFMNIYMWSVIISTIIFFGSAIFISNAEINRNGIDGLMKKGESQNNKKIETLPFLLCVLPIINILLSIFLIAIMALINLYSAGKIKYDILDAVDKVSENK